jgi:hypothetical protein
LRSIVILAGVALVAGTAVLGGSGAGSYTYQTYCATCRSGRQGRRLAGEDPHREALRPTRIAAQRRPVPD